MCRNIKNTEAVQANENFRIEPPSECPDSNAFETPVPRGEHVMFWVRAEGGLMERFILPDGSFRDEEVKVLNSNYNKVKTPDFSSKKTERYSYRGTQL